MKITVTLIGIFICLNQLKAQTTSFSFSAAAQTTAGWINVAGDPSLAVITASDPSTGIGITSVATANWYPYNRTNAAYDGGGVNTDGFFPGTVFYNQWFQYNPSGSGLAYYNQSIPQFIISGLNVDSVYTIKLSGSNAFGFDSHDTRYTVAGVIVYPPMDLNTVNNTANGSTFHNIAPDATGKIMVYVNTVGATELADISGMQVIRERFVVPTPTVRITSPANNDILAEDGNIIINATATETGGTISKVEFFADSTKIGESLSPPYTFTWINPDEGKYTLKARAIDAAGTTNSSSIQVSVESLSSFWSTTGNIAMNSDSFFLGTVDTSKLVIRTRNVPRMAIDSNGNITIPLAHPSVFSIGGTANNPVTHPAFQVYNNGDLVASTTMDRSVSTEAQTGMRYYAKNGILEIGGSDRLDTMPNPIVYGHWPTSGIIINSDSSNIVKSRLINTFFAGDENRLDSGNRFEDNFIGTEASHFTSNMGTMIRTVMGTFGTFVDAPVDASILSGQANPIFKPVESIIIGGVGNVTQDTSASSLIEGSSNKYGGIGQLVAGRWLVNKTPSGTALGNGNVDFTSFNYTGLRGTVVPGLSGYPLFVVGNGSANDGSIRSNAITVLFNGRTQINSAGFTNNLAQTDVTPKAALEVVSTNSGVLLPKLTNAQRNSIASGDLLNGLLLYNTDSSVFQFYNGSAWTSVGSGAAGGSGHWQFSGGVQYDSVNNIAIGTNNPQGYKLAVNGTAIFTQIKVKPFISWPDYVFKKGYDLPDLAKLERYIAIHKHLPGIASQSEIQRDGIDVGGNQAALLKKVEELTLYLIDEHKKSHQQEKEIEQLKAQNKRLDSQQQEIDQLKEILKKLTDKN